MTNQALLLDAFRNPDNIKRYSVKQWNQILPQIRVSFVALYFLEHVESHKLIDFLPEKIRTYLENEQYKVRFQRRQTLYEIEKINESLNAKAIDAIYLKGAAYVLADLPIANWRNFSDIDLLVNKEKITQTELMLNIVGYISQKTDDYDQQYYREYMHEIPPLQHVTRGVVVDLHHNILPTCINTPVNIDELSLSAIDDKMSIGCKTFSPEAMFIHSAVHLFHEGEFEKGLRDLLDLATLYRHFNQQDKQFDDRTISLAKQVSQEKSLYFALRYINAILDVELSLIAVEFITRFESKYRYSGIADFIFKNVLIPHHANCQNTKSSVAKFLAYIRGHLLRMPLRLLIPHLIMKSWMKFKSEDSHKSPDRETPNL